MRKITTAITAAALALNMLAATVPAAAVTGYDSAYAGESAFVNIVGGQTQNFQVFFANTGTTSWVKGTGTQVDLAACLEDKTTCNAQDASEATWNSGWLSATRYASTSQTTTPPGSLGTFSYNITAPVGVAAGIYHFNGDVVLASTGEKIHPEGYFQDANTGAASGAATLTSISPSTGTTAGGTTVALGGTGFVCTPAFPTVSFGGSNAVVTSCGATALTAKSPAHAAGSVAVNVTNAGSGPSNSLNYLYADQDAPIFTSIAVAGNTITATFNEPVCRTFGTTWNAGDWTINNVSNPAALVDTGDTFPICTSATDRSNAVTSGLIIIDPTTPVPNGAFVETTLNETVLASGVGTNTRIIDTAGNAASAPISRQATATAPETTKPTIISASGAVGGTTVVLKFSEPVRCASATPPPGDWILNDFNTANDPDPTVTSVTGCGTTQATADDSITLNTGTNLPADTTYTLTYTNSGANEVEDVAGNDLANSSIVFTTGAADFTPPTMIDARMTNNQATTDFNDSGDSFSVTFSEKMNGNTASDIFIQDQDGTTGIARCGTNATCSWNTAVTTLSVALTGAVLATPTPGAGTTPNMQIPFNITSMTAIKDVAGNPPNVLGSSDRLVDFE